MQISILLLMCLCGAGIARAAPAPNASSEDLGLTSADPGLPEVVSPEGREVSVKQDAETTKAGLSSITDIKADENSSDMEETSQNSDVDDVEPPILGFVTSERRPVTVPERPSTTSDTAESSKQTTKEKHPEQEVTEDVVSSQPSSAAVENEAPILGSSSLHSIPATVPEDPQDTTNTSGLLEQEKAEAEVLPSQSSAGSSTEDEAVKAGSADDEEEATDSVSDSDFISLLADATDTGFDLLLDLLDDTDADYDVSDYDDYSATEEQKASEESSSGDSNLPDDDSPLVTEEHKSSASSSFSGSATNNSKSSVSASAGSASASTGSGGSASASSGSGGSASTSSGGTGSPSISIETDYDYKQESDYESDYPEVYTDYGEDYKDYGEESDNEYADYTEDYDEDYNDYDDSEMPNLSFSIFDDTVPRPPPALKEKEEKEQGATPCEWGVVNCCHDSNMGSRIKCFDRLGCPGAWFENLCTPSIKRGVLRKVFRTVQG